MASSEKYPLSQLNKWRLTDKPHMDDYNYDNRLLDETAMWKATYDPRGLEHDAFLSQTVYEEAGGSTAAARVAVVPGIANWAQLANVPIHIKASAAGAAGDATLDIQLEDNTLLGAKPLMFPETGSNSLSAVAPADWVREGGVYTAVYTGQQLVVLNTQVQQASTTAPGIVQLNDATDSDSSATAATSKAVKDTYDLALLATTNIRSLVEEIILERSQLEHPVGSYYISLDDADPADIFGFGTWALTNMGQALVGVDSTDADFLTPGKVGGAKTVALAAANLASHSHAATGLAATVASGGAHAHTASSGTVSADHAHYVSGTTSVGGGHAHSTAQAVLYYPGSGVGAIGSGSSYGRAGVGTSAAGDHAHTWGAYTGGITANHTHGITVNSGGAHAHTASVSGSTAATGSGTAHNNLQPYQTAYIWKRTA